jgi:hypothetical protein
MRLYKVKINKYYYYYYFLREMSKHFIQKSLRNRPKPYKDGANCSKITVSKISYDKPNGTFEDVPWLVSQSRWDGGRIPRGPPRFFFSKSSWIP